LIRRIAGEFIPSHALIPARFKWGPKNPPQYESRNVPVMGERVTAAERDAAGKGVPERGPVMKISTFWGL
jgi:hypothetical protein